MNITTKELVKSLLFVVVSVWYGTIFSQIKTETQVITISTGHPSLTLALFHNGVGVECKIVNSNPTVKYDIAYTVDYDFVCGTAKKTISDKGIVQPNGEMTSLSQLMSDCVESDGKRTANSVRNVQLTNFNPTPIQEEKATTNSTANSNSEVNYTSESATTINSQEQSQNTQQQNNTTTQIQPENSSNGASLANVQQIIDENRRISEERLGVKSYANDAEMVNDVAEEVIEIIGIFQSNRELDRRMEEEARLARLEVQQEIDNRKAILQEFKPKEIPLGSKEKANKIYYFVYAYDNSINYQYGATVYLSNVFEIGTYDDGTRAYTAIINSEIANLTPCAEVLHGYYYTQEEAEQLRQVLISVLQNNGVLLSDIYYKGKPTTSMVKSTTTEQGTETKPDFWD